MIEARALNRSFGNVAAVRNVSLDVQPGEIYGLVGADGAGKTTTLRLLVGALRADSGSANICGFDIAKQTEQARANIGYLSQKFSLYEDMTVLENIHFFAEVRGMRRNEWLPRSEEILDFVGLSNFRDRFAGKLSGGMKQKLGLATALVSKPKLLLLDEPTTGVDPVTRQDFWKLIIKLSTEQNDGGFSVLLTTPYMDEAARCHRIGFMKDGQIVREGKPTQLRDAFEGNVIEARVTDGHYVKDLLKVLPGIKDVRTFGDRLHIIVDPVDTDAVIAEIVDAVAKSGYELIEVKRILPSLEDVFISLSAGDYKEGG